MKKLSFLILFIAILVPLEGTAWNDGITHPHILKQAVRNSNLDAFLQNNLGMEPSQDPERPGTFFNGDYVTSLIQKGAELEDKPACRASNHFHDPLVEDWTMSGLTDTHWLVNLWCYGFGFGQYPPDEINSNVTWATGYRSPSEKEDNGVRDFNEWDWDSAREYYYIYLTGIDFSGIEIAPDENARNGYMAKSFRSLGQVIHLLQDMAVPAHVRNDFSQGHTDILPDSHSAPWNWIGNRFETFVKKNDTENWFNESTGGTLNDISLTNFWDTNNYDGSVPITDENMLGIAEYTNLNFVSSYTIFSENYPYPNEGSTNIEKYILGELSPEIVTDEDGVTREEIYLAKTQHGVEIDHFVIPSYLSEEMFGIDGGLERTYRLDERCFNDYAALLIPRVIGYSAGVLDYFFRGELEVSALPLFSENASYGLRLKIKNVTPTQEAMIKGDDDQFALVCRYSQEGANPDGTEDKFVTAAEYSCREGNCDEIQYEDEVTIDFRLPWEEENRIGMQIYESDEDSVKCMLVFKGTLGAEETAVVGKYFTLGQDQIKFNEEWDNGLTGNHPWDHTLPDDPQNPDNGITSNGIAPTEISSNSLIKDNIRYTGYDSSRINETSVDFNDVVTPYTYLQFKIDDLSKTETSTFHWQAMVLHFNDGRILQMTQSGQGYVINGTTATYTFSLGANMNLNIFEMFQNAGISIPDPFYIESIDFMQQLFQESQPTTTETSQHMEVDYIRLIEEKHEE